jgi:hypothetical protein
MRKYRARKLQALTKRDKFSRRNLYHWSRLDCMRAQGTLAEALFTKCIESLGNFIK